MLIGRVTGQDATPKNNLVIAIAAVKRSVFAGDADAVLPFARFVCWKTSGGCLVTASYGNAPTAAPSMGLATSEKQV